MNKETFDKYVKVEPDFLSAEDSDKLYEEIRKLPFSRQLTVPWGLPKRHQVVSFSEKFSPRLGYVGPHFKLSEAPQEIAAFQRRLSAHINKNANYLSCVLYEDGQDFMDFHQHREDRGYDAAVYLMSTGATRLLGFREAEKIVTNNGRLVYPIPTYIDAVPGTLITMSSEANDKIQHAVPKARSKHT